MYRLIIHILSPDSLTLLLASPAWSAPTAELIDGREYPAVLQREIGQAKKSITACLYLFSVNVARSSSKPMQIVESLVAAQARGVKVEVILDGSDEWWVEEGREKNMAVYDYLTGRGLEVFLTTTAATVHAKGVVFDGVSVLSGSTNWTDAAFSRNVELNTLVRDPAVAREALAVIQQAGRRKPDVGNVVSLPAAFLSAKYLGALVRPGDTRAIDAYLWLLKEASGKDAVPVDYDRLIEHLGIPGRTVAEGRYALRQTLGRLRSRGLIQYDSLDLTAPEVRLVPLPGESVKIPLEYWDWGWPRRLSLPGKAMYWIGLYRSARSTLRPRWTASLEALSHDHGAKIQFFSHGTIELRRANLVEVDYDKPIMSSNEYRRPNIYTPRPLYSPDLIPQTLERLERAHGKDKLARAQEYAALVYEDSNPDALQTFILLENQYGPARLQEVARILREFKGDNSKRSLPYFIAAVKDEGPR